MMRFIRNNKGSTLSLVIVALLMTFLMLSIVAMLTQTNIKQASSQEYGLQAFYAARSGVELAYGALWVAGSGGTTLLKDLKDNNIPAAETVDFGDAGTADVSIDYVKNGAEEKVTIESTGHYKGTTKTIILKVYFEVDATGNSTLKDIVWS